jgi:hypothetical protein
LEENENSILEQEATKQGNIKGSHVEQRPEPENMMFDTAPRKKGYDEGTTRGR